MNFRNPKFWLLLLAIFLGIFIFIYGNYNPYKTQYFPKCTFYSLTGYKCPGCGSQRASYFILHGNLKQALKENFLFVISIPLLLFILLLNFNIIKNKKLQKFFLSYEFFTGFMIVIVLFWIFRNIFGF